MLTLGKKEGWKEEQWRNPKKKLKWKIQIQEFKQSKKKTKQKKPIIFAKTNKYISGRTDLEQKKALICSIKNERGTQHWRYNRD